MIEPQLRSAISTVPPRRWGVGVSGGADSVALLALLCERPDVAPHVIHLDHQTRGRESTADADFVRQLAASRGIQCTVGLREQVEQALPHLLHNASARYRDARFAFFGKVVAEHNLSGVLLAHHADDQAETILHRLVRGSGAGGLPGMAPRTRMGNLLILRPLLGVRREMLREFLRACGQSWREDASNASNAYLRNRLRRHLAGQPHLHDALLELATACRCLRDWARSAAPELADSFRAADLARLPDVLAHESARRWLQARGGPPAELSHSVLDALIEMARDAGSPPRLHFPGALLVRRKAGRVSLAT